MFFPPTLVGVCFGVFLAEIFSLCFICFICFIVVSLLFHCCCICFHIWHVCFMFFFSYVSLLLYVLSFFHLKTVANPDHWHDHHLVLLIHGPLGDESPWAVWFLILQLLLETCIQAAHRKSSLKMRFFQLFVYGLHVTEYSKLPTWPAVWFTKFPQLKHFLSCQVMGLLQLLPRYFGLSPMMQSDGQTGQMWSDHLPIQFDPIWSRSSLGWYGRTQGIPKYQLANHHYPKISQVIKLHTHAYLAGMHPSKVAIANIARPFGCAWKCVACSKWPFE